MQRVTTGEPQQSRWHRRASVRMYRRPLYQQMAIANLIYLASVPHQQHSATSAPGRVSRASSVDTAVRNRTRDEGGPLEAGSQALLSILVGDDKIIIRHCIPLAMGPVDGGR
jgi:hypothetical protein